MKVNYFTKEKVDDDDIMLQLVIGQGYVPRTCLLGGFMVMMGIKNGDDPCRGCAGPRERCHGR